MTYAEMLRANGATEEEVKLLDVPSARKAFDAQQAAIAAATADAEARVNSYKEEADKWYNNTILPNYTKMEQERAAALANESRARALILASTDEGLKKVAADMGFKPDGTPAAAPANPAAPNSFDASKYVTVDALNQMSDSVGAGLAALQDMVLEHSQLFPDRRLDVRAIRAEAVAARKNVYDYWEQKFGVPAARTAREEAAKKAHDDAIRKEERDKTVAELASQYANPNTVPASSSSNIFTPRPSAGRDKAPWESSLDGANGSNDRVAKAAKLFVEKQAARTN
jgi:hypothetical protein